MRLMGGLSQLKRTWRVHERYALTIFPHKLQPPCGVSHRDACPVGGTPQPARANGSHEPSVTQLCHAN